MSRDAILAKIREAAVQPYVRDGDRRAAVHARLDGSLRGTVPARAQGRAPDLRLQFKAALESQSATVLSAAVWDGVPHVVAAYLMSHNTGLAARAGADPVLQSLPWQEAGLSLRTGAARPADSASVSTAFAAVAETGTLVLASGTTNPASLAFLPETHVIVLDAAGIVGGMEDAFDLVRERYGRHTMPRSLNLISGPSRTGDIGGRIVLGAHGPRRLCVVIVG